MVVTYDAHDLPAPPAAATPGPHGHHSRPRLSPSAWALIGMAAVSLGLLAWMLVRWFRSPVTPAERLRPRPG